MKFVATFQCPNKDCRRHKVPVRTDMTAEEVRTAFSHPLVCSACCTELVDGDGTGEDYVPCPCCFPGEVQS